MCSFFFFSTDSPPTEIYTLSLHDALPICLENYRRCVQLPYRRRRVRLRARPRQDSPDSAGSWRSCPAPRRSEEHTSELQSHSDLVCRLLLEKKKNKTHTISYNAGHH